MNETKLEEYEEMCPNCNGEGVIGANIQYPDGTLIKINSMCCPYCNGTKKVDWLEKIFGKKNKFFKWTHENPRLL